MMATILYSFVGLCINKLQDIIKDEAILILGVKEDLIELQLRMNQIRLFLHDAEQRRVEESAVNNWLAQLRDAMYDADDIIDIAKSKGSKLLPEYYSPLSSKPHICNGLYLPSCFPKIWARHEVAVKIRSLNKKIDNISKSQVFVSLKETQLAGNVLTHKKRIASSLVDPNIIGKEVAYACRKVVDLMLAHKENKFYKVAIVGLGGVGKTTLAQMTHNDKRIKGAFKKQAWVCVSKDNQSDIDLLKEVLRNIGVYQDHGESVGELQSILALAIKDKNLFLVLDDVWQSDTWTNLLRTPLHNANKVRVVVTTRLDTVAIEIGVDHMHRVDLMSADTGWELLLKSMNTDEKEVQTMRDIGIDIVQKCGGLPLAIKLVGRVLATKDQTENEWEKILGTNAWSMSNVPSEMKGALYLSYEDLSYNLKQCFVYCAMSPEDALLFRDDMVRAWVAEGFIDEKDDQLLEDTAEEYYYELICRNLLHPDYSYADLSRCRVHDLLMQLACYLSSEECFIGDPELIGVNIVRKVRRIAILTKKDTVVLPSMDREKYKVRTLISSYGKAQRINCMIFECIPYIRVLDLTGSVIQNIPSCIGRLIHLRLLDLDGTDITCLPESICHLVNLQILNLNGCAALHTLPSGITQLFNLRRIGLMGTPIYHVPIGISKLKFVNDLQGYPVTGNNDKSSKMQDGWNLEELGPLSCLKRLALRNLERAAHHNTNPLLLGKRYLKELTLFCTECRDGSYSEENIIKIEKVFEMLVPPRNLEDLRIRYFFGRRFPTWLGTAIHLSSVKYIRIVNCKSCVYLPQIGELPNLKFLRIEGAAAIAQIGPEFMGSGQMAFPKLETLVMEDMPNWEEWTFDVEKQVKVPGGVKQNEDFPPPEMQVLPRLSDLSLLHCPKLRSLPQNLGQMTANLKVLCLRDLCRLEAVINLPSLSEMLSIARCESLETISNIPQVRDLRIASCQNLRHVEQICSLEQLWLDEDMLHLSSLWVPELKHQHQQVYGDDLDVYTWLS